jgi:hypothetical protein
VAGEKATQILAAAGKHGPPETWCSTCCAKFVSQVFKEAGYPGVFASTNSVPTLVGEFLPSQRSSVLADAQPADMIVFGPDPVTKAPYAHVMIYEGNNFVVGTVTDSETGITTVQRKDVGAIVPPFVLVLQTGMAAGQTVDLNPVDAANAVATATANAITAGFGTAFAWVPGFALSAGILVFAAVLVWTGVKEVVNASG